MLKLKLGDKVRVMQGRDRGREGVIAKIYPKKGAAIVEGINIFKKHVKKSVAKDGKGGIFDIPKPIHLSKLSLIDSKTKKPAKVGFKMEGKKKMRINKKTGKFLDKVTKS